MNDSNKAAYPVSVFMVDSEYEFYNEFNGVYDKAKKYIAGFKWCRKVENAWLYFNLGTTLCIFLFEIQNSQSNDDNFIWVIVGDLPSMYLDTHGPASVKDVLMDYVDLGNEWADHVLKNEDLDDCYPFNAEPVPELAIWLKKRTEFIQNVLLDEIDNVPLSKHG